MTQDVVLGTLLAAAAVTVATAAGWLAALVAGYLIAHRVRCSATRRARLLAHTRLLPLTFTLLIVPTQIVAFLRFEAGGEESAGPLLIALALVGVALVAEALRAALGAARGTRAVGRSWRLSAVPVTLPGWAQRAWQIHRRYPVVAIVGILRPQLFVARQVVETCTPEELAAIAAHERAHVRAADNLLRWLFRVTPGAGFCAYIARRLEGEWAAAAEEAADAAARREVPSIDLASALTTVARLATGVPPELVSSSALVGSSDLKARVERLLDPTAPEPPRRLGWIAGAAVMAGVMLLQTTPVASLLHELFEMLVRKGG